MNKQINLAIQVLPRAKNIHPYDLVDKAIEVIKNSGVKYLVCPFETVMEGNYDELMKIVEDIHKACYEAGAEEIICNLKIQSNSSMKVEIDDKMKKYQK
jgi:uncharacterized protein (TIGR00106 family)